MALEKVKGNLHTGVRPKPGVSEVYFGYHAKMEGYANMSSDITELSEIFQPLSKLIYTF